jgi:hypothetical protein
MLASPQPPDEDELPVLPKPPRLLVEPDEVEPPGAVVVPPDDGARPTTVGVVPPVPVGARAVVVLRPLLPPHHQRPGPDER